MCFSIIRNHYDMHIMIECRSDGRYFISPKKHYVHNITVVHVDFGEGGFRRKRREGRFISEYFYIPLFAIISIISYRPK